MDNHDLHLIISEISNLKNRGIKLHEGLSIDLITSEFSRIEAKLKHGYYVLPKMYSLIKKIQSSVNLSLLGNDINEFIQLFSIVESVRRKLSDEYNRKSEIALKVKNIKQIINEDSRNCKAEMENL